MSNRKPFNTKPGYVCSKCSAPGNGYVVVYRARELPDFQPDEAPWVVVCETHQTSTSASSETKARASMKTPTAWCSLCARTPA